MGTEVVFNQRRDYTQPIINPDGTFMCCACLKDNLPATEQSADPRYCQRCHDFLCKEAATLPKNQRGDWVPTDWAPRLPATAAPVEPCDINANGVSNNRTDGESAIENIVTGNNQEGSGEKHRSRGRPRSARNALPLEKILELHQSGQGSREIADQVGANYRTVARLIKESQGALL